MLQKSIYRNIKLVTNSCAEVQQYFAKWQAVEPRSMPLIQRIHSKNNLQIFHFKGKIGPPICIFIPNKVPKKEFQQWITHYSSMPLMGHI